MEWNEINFTFFFRGVSSNDFSSLETLCKKIIKEKQAFERLEVKKETLLEMFKVNWTVTDGIYFHHSLMLFEVVTLGFSVPNGSLSCSL